jgi:hypothetical protein
MGLFCGRHLYGVVAHIRVLLSVLLAQSFTDCGMLEQPDRNKTRISALRISMLLYSNHLRDL